MMLLPIKLGLGGPLGGGAQWLSWIHVDDVIGGIAHLCRVGDAGVFNFTAPESLSQAQFSRVAATVLLRPYGFPTPGWPMRLALGEQADLPLEGQRVSRHWGARQAWQSSDSFSLHYQYTQTDKGEYWCVTYLETEAQVAITIGTSGLHARYFRGANTLRRVNARTADNQPDPDLISRWEGVAWPSASERSHVMSALPASERPFTPFPGVDVVDVYRFLDRQTRQRRGRLVLDLLHVV